MDVVGHDNVGRQIIEPAFPLSDVESIHHQSSDPVVSQPKGARFGAIEFAVRGGKPAPRRRIPKAGGPGTREGAPEAPGDEKACVVWMPVGKPSMVVQPTNQGRRNRLPHASEEE